MRILLYGDSNTWGYDARTGCRFERRYPAVLRERMPDDQIIEEGINGRTLCFDDPFDPDRNGTKNVQMVIKSHVPIDVFVVMLGTNDAKRIYHTNVMSLYKGMRTLLRKVKDPVLYQVVGKKPQILIVRPPRMNPAYRSNEMTVYSFGQEGYDMLENAGKALAKIAADMHADYFDPDVTAGTYDGVHLDPETHAILAERLAAKLEEYR